MSIVPLAHKAPRFSGQSGHTLLELIIVILIIGMAVVAAMPSTTPARQERLTLAASAVADAFRFAREEARRTGTVHGVVMNLNNGLVRVFRLDEAPDPNQKVFDVYQPASKQLYEIQMGESPYGGVTLSGSNGVPTGLCYDTNLSIAFDAGGVVRCIEPTSVRINNVSFALAAEAFSQTVAIDSYTGRVVVQ